MKETRRGNGGHEVIRSNRVYTRGKGEDWRVNPLQIESGILTTYGANHLFSSRSIGI